MFSKKIVNENVCGICEKCFSPEERKNDCFCWTLDDHCKFCDIHIYHRLCIIKNSSILVDIVEKPTIHVMYSCKCGYIMTFKVLREEYKNILLK